MDAAEVAFGFAILVVSLGAGMGLCAWGVVKFLDRMHRER